MAVRSFYTDVRPDPNVDAFATFLTNWVGQRGAENAAERQRKGGGEDPAKLANLELEIADTLGKLQEGKGRTLGERDVQALKTNSALVTALMGGYNAAVAAQSRVATAKIGARASQYSADAETYKRTRAAMGIDSDEQRHTLSTYQSAMKQARDAGPGSAEAQSVVTKAVQAALTQEGAGEAGPRRDRVMYDAWKAATNAGLTAEANHIAGMMGIRGDNVESEMARRYGTTTPEERGAAQDQITRGGVGGFPFYAALETAIKNASDGSPETLTEHSERGPDDDEEPSEDGEAPVRRKMKVKGDGGSVSFESDLSAAVRGDKGASERIAAAFDAAIEEQRALAADVRKRREAALSHADDTGLPTGNVLIDNPNTYVRPYKPAAYEATPAAYGRAAMAPRPEVFRAVDEPTSDRGGSAAAEYARDYGMMSETAPSEYPAPGVDTKRSHRADLLRLAPDKAEVINAMSDDEVSHMWNLDKTQAAFVKLKPIWAIEDEGHRRNRAKEQQKAPDQEAEEP